MRQSNNDEKRIIVQIKSEIFGNCLGGENKYIVPDFQREYRWRDKQIEQLWEDLTTALENDTRHFLGLMIFYGDEPELYIIDGQQRLTTLLILLASLRDFAKDIIKKYGAEISDTTESDRNIGSLRDFISEIQKRYIERTSRGPREREFRLVLQNPDDNSFFREFILELSDDGLLEKREKLKMHKIRESQKWIFKAYETYYNKIKEYVEQRVGNNILSDETLNELWALLNTIREKLEVLISIARSDETAFIVFETINERGTPLTVIDLVKNKLYSTISSEEMRNIFSKKWRELVHIMEEIEIARGKKVKSIDILNMFLRYYWCSSRRKVTKKNLYPELKRFIQEKLRSDNDVIKFVDELIDEAKRFKELFLPPSKLGECAEYLYDMVNIIDMRQHLILLLSASKIDNKDDFKKWIKLTYLIATRYIIISKGSANRLENIFSSLAIELRKKIESNEYSSFENFISKLDNNMKNRLKEIYVDDEEIKNRLMVRKFVSKPDERKAKYLLKKINEYILNMDRDTKETKVILNMDELQLEHIEPRTSNRIEDAKYKLGNLTLIKGEWNQSMSNKDFTYKKNKYYGNSEIPTTRELVNYDKWCEEIINKRTEKLSNYCINIWSWPEFKKIILDKESTQ